MPSSVLPEHLETLFAKLISFDTTSRNPNRACIDFIRNDLDALGVTTDILPSDDGTKACLWATVGASDNPGIVLAGHTDVVPVDGQDWTSDPFTLTQRDDKFFARGACDMKGFIATALATARDLVGKALPQPVHFAFTYDEEISMIGAARLTEYLRDRHVKPSWVWVGEPTELKIIDQHKGVAAYRTNITGISGHSGTPDLGLNAIDVAHDFMGILRAVASERRAQPFVPSRFDPSYTTMNLGIVQGGTAENIIAEHCEVLWQLRAHPGDTAAAFVSTVEERGAQLVQPRFSKFAPRAGMKICTCFDIPPLMPTPNNKGEKAIADATGQQGTEAVSFGTEAGFYQSLGADVVVCGPGSIHQAHQPDEFIALDQLARCAALMHKILL